MNPKTPRTVRVATLFIIMMASITLIGAAYVLTWAYQPSRVLEVKNSPVPVQPPEVKDGGKIYLTINYCQKKSLSVRTKVHLIGEQGADINVVWPTSYVNKGCNLLTDVPVSIPGQTPTDKYYVEFTSCADINPLKKDKCVTFRSKQFRVINSKLNPGDAQVQEKM